MGVLTPPLRSPQIAAQLGNLSFGHSSSSDSKNEISKKRTSLELGITKSKNSRASQFIASIDDDVRFSLEEIKAPHESIDTLLMDEKVATMPKKLTPVQEEQAAYNATINRVRTPPPFHNTTSATIL